MKTRIGIVGAGGVVERIHLPACALVPDVEIAGICDPNAEVRTRIATQPGIRQTFASFEEMIEQVRPEVVIVATPPQTHFEICRQALNAGAHVLCEKPFMATLEEADRVIAIAREKNLLLRVNNQYRFMSFYSETKRRLQAGEFGRVFYIQCWQQMFHPPSTETNWRSELKQYVLYEFGTHALDLVSFFFDALPESVSAHTPRCRPEYDADVLVQMTLRYPEERIATFSFNRVSHAPEKYLEMRLDCERASLRISLGGVARASIEWSRNARRPVAKWGLLKGGQARAEIDGAGTAYCSSRQSEFATATADHLRQFLAEMREPVRSTANAVHAREILRLVFAGYESATSGDTVHLERAGK
jgi:predicted dehydrogenase